MPVNSNRSARINPSRSSGAQIPYSGGDDGGVGNIAELAGSLGQIKRKEGGFLGFRGLQEKGKDIAVGVFQKRLIRNNWPGSRFGAGKTREFKKSSSQHLVYPE